VGEVSARACYFNDLKEVFISLLVLKFWLISLLQAVFIMQRSAETVMRMSKSAMDSLWLAVNDTSGASRLDGLPTS
jgi:hypothetical protein